MRRQIKLQRGTVNTNVWATTGSGALRSKSIPSMQAQSEAVKIYGFGQLEDNRKPPSSIGNVVDSNQKARAIRNIQWPVGENPLR